MNVFLRSPTNVIRLSLVLTQPNLFGPEYITTK